MITAKAILKFILFFAVSLLVSCVGDSSKKGNGTAPEVVNRLIANNITPADFPSRSQSIFTLSYTSLDNELASSCSVSQLNSVSVTQACSCDGAGVCVVGITGNGVYSGAASLTFNVVAGGKNSTTGRANFNITAPPPGSNVPPTITAIAAQSTTEGTAISNIPFTIADSDSSVSCSNVAAASSNTTVVPAANVVISGSGTSCKVTVTPAANQMGSSNITLTLTDTGTPLPAQTAISTFTTTVTAFNDPPTISTIAAQITNEDVQITGIAFTIGDVDSSVSCSNVTASSAASSLVSNGNIIISGTAPNCLVRVAPSLNQSGTAMITLTLTDNGSPMPAKTAATTFALMVVSVNDVPVINSITTQSTTENIAKVVNFTITDVDSSLSCASSLAMTSSNTTLVPNTNVAFSGIAPNCTATITPATGLHGAANLTLTVSDNGFPMPIQSAATTFTLNVVQVNHAPTITSITNKTIAEDAATSSIPFTIADTDSTIYCTNVVGTSNNTTLVPNANIVVTGTAPNCSVVVTPAANGYGSATITLTLSDNGTPLPALTATSLFTLTVTAVNDAPTMSSITTKTTTEGNASAPIAYTINDVDSTLSCASSVTATSSNTTLIPNANIAFAGTAPNCTLVITPSAGLFGSSTISLTLTDNGTPLPALTAARTFLMNVTQVNQPPTISSITTQTTNEDTATSAIAFTIADSDSTIYCSNVTGTSSNAAIVDNAHIVVTGTAPNCVATITPVADAYGTSSITLTLTDNGTPAPSLTDTSIFNLTVNAVNDAPSISSITSKTTNEGAASSAIAFTINDSDSTLTCATSVTMTSSNTTLIPDANVVFAGTAPNCTAVVTPASANYGTATLTFTLADNGTPLPVLTATTSFLMTVTQVNQAPTISAISNQSTDEDTMITGIAFTIADADSSVYCNNVVGTSSNTALAPNANVVISGTAPNCLARITPVANANGATNITLTLTDNGSPIPAQTATSVFGLTVNAVNDAPTISSITNKTTDEDTPTSSIAFTISDSDSTLTCNGDVAGTSSNTTLIPNANIVISGTAPNCIAVVTPAADQSGAATITLVLTDNGTPTPALTASTAFNVTVAAVPDLSGTLTVANNLSGIASSYSTNSYARTIKFSGISSDKALSSVEVCLGSTAGACDVSTWVEATGYTTSGTAPSVTLGGTYKLKSGVGGAQTFTLAASCGTTHSYYYSIRATDALSKVSNIISTPAWTFWEPTCLGSSVLAQWLDATESDTITIVTGVYNWNDKSANARAVTQATGGKQPALGPSAMGTGLPGITFNGTSSSLGRASFVYAQGATSIFAVIKAPAIGANKYLFSEAAGAGINSSYSPFITSTTNTITTVMTNNAGTTDLNLPTTSTTIFDNTIRLGMIEDTGTSFYTYSNGTAQSQAISNYTRSASTMTTYRLGSRFKANAESAWISGTLGEFIITNGVLSSLNRQKLEGYSAHKWGVNSNLPGAHPYLTSPP